MLELTIPLAALAFLGVLLALAAAHNAPEREDDPPYSDWMWPMRKTRR